MKGWGDILYQKEMAAQREQEERLKAVIDDEYDLVVRWTEEVFGKPEYNKHKLYLLLDQFYEEWEEWREANEQ